MRTLSAGLTTAQKSYNINPKWKVDMYLPYYEDLSTYTEVDTGSKMTVTSARATVTGLTETDETYLYYDFGANYFDGDFTHYVTTYMSAGAGDGKIYPWMLANAVGTRADLNPQEDFIYVQMYYNNGSGPTIRLYEEDNSSVYFDTTAALSYSTLYYLKVVRDESVGTYGTLYCYIYSDPTRATLVDTLTLTLHTSKKDYRYAYAMNTVGSGADDSATGYSENFDVGIPARLEATYQENDYLLDIKHTDRQYSSTAELLFTNHDGTFTSNDYTGYQAVISYGALVSGVATYSSCAPLWVKNQNLISGRGALLCRMELIGLFDLLDQDHASAEYTQDVDNTDAIDTIFSAICGGTLAPYTHCSPVVVVDTNKDTLFDTYIPAESFSIAMGESRLSALKRLIALTGSVMRADNDGSNGVQITVFAPTTTGATYDYDYELAAGEHAFFAKGVTNRIVLPNKVTVSSYPDTGDGYTGNATDAASYALIPKDEYWYLPVADNDECANLATAILLHYQIGNGSGSGEVVMNVGAELYDYVDIIDSRESDTIVGNTLYQHRHCGGGKWNMTIGFGEPELGRGFLDIAMREPDKENLLQEVNRLRYDMDTLIGYLKRIEGDVADHSRMLSPNGLTASILRNAMQPYTVDLNIKAKDADEIYWYGSAGVGNDGSIEFADGRSQTITEKVQASAQAISGVQWLYFTMGSGTLSVTSTWADAVSSNKGVVALCVENTAGDGKCMILPCNGREPLINAIAISVDYLSAINADMGTLTAGLIKLLKSGTSWTSWKNPNTASGLALGFDEDAYESTGDAKLEVYTGGDIGTAINKWGITLFDEDKSFVTCSTIGSASITTSGGGAAINIAYTGHGLTTSDEVVIHGTDDYNGKYAVASVVDANNITVAVAYVANETCTLYKIQCKVDSSGNITNTYGTVRWNADGISIKNVGNTAYLRFLDADDNVDASVYLDSNSDFHFYANGRAYFDAQIFSMDGKVIIEPDNDLTISGDTITVTGSNHRLIGEGTPAAADDLSSINGAQGDGHILILSAQDDAVTITVKDGVGNIRLSGSDFAMDHSSDKLFLVYDLANTDWCEISRSSNG